MLQNHIFNHEGETINIALGVSREMMIRCRERIFFCHFANSLQSIELFSSRDEAPKEFTTVSGDLQRVLNMVHDPLEYELTLLYFNMYHRMANGVFAQWQMENNGDDNSEEQMKIQLLKLLHKLKDLSDKAKEKTDDDQDDDDVNGKLSEESMVKRVDFVKKSKYNFSKYMELVGFPLSNDSNFDVDGLIKGLFE
jgi:hypothetical protein